MEVEVEVVNLFKSFRGGRDEVLKGMSVHFPKGKLTYILGPSGTGKSVLIKHILGLLKPDRGQILIDQRDITTLSEKELTQIRLKIGVLFQNSALFDDKTVFENVAFPLREHGNFTENEILERVKRTLSLLGMREGYDKYPNEISGGMKKRVGLARAIIAEPALLLYDEPTTGLDPITRITVDDLIATVKRELKTTSIVISHDIPAALHLADQIVFLSGGKVAFCGSAADLKKCQHESVVGFLEAERRTVEALS